MTMTSASDLLVFERGEGDDALLCVFNLGHHAVEWTVPKGWSVVEAVNVAGDVTGPLPSLAGLLLARAG